MLSVIVRHHNHQSSIIALRNILEATSNRFRCDFESFSKQLRNILGPESFSKAIVWDHWLKPSQHYPSWVMSHHRIIALRYYDSAFHNHVYQPWTTCSFSFQRAPHNCSNDVAFSFQRAPHNCSNHVAPTRQRRNLQITLRLHCRGETCRFSI